MRLIEIEDCICIVNNEVKGEPIIYNSYADFSEYERHSLYTSMIFLENSGKIQESNKIREYLGKFVTMSKIPKRIPNGNYNVDVDLQYIEEFFDRYRKHFNFDMNPDFQRVHVWSETQQIKFIEFILQGGQCPTVFLNYPNWQLGSQKLGDTMVIVDGKQRLTAMFKFVNNELRVFKDIEGEDGYLFKDFIDLHSISFKININNLSDKKDIYEWYLQINEGQVPHTDEELEKVRRLKNKLN